MNAGAKVVLFSVIECECRMLYFLRTFGFLFICLSTFLMSLPLPNTAVQWLRSIFQVARQRIVYHSVGWLGYVLFFTAYQFNGNNLGFVLGNELIKIVFVGMMVYINIAYLVPRYLSEKRFVVYLLWVGFVVLVVSPLEVFALYLKLRNYPEFQYQLVSNQSGVYFLNTFIVCVSTLLKIGSDWTRYQRIRRDLEQQRLNAELKFLRAQINPHFLFNTLNSLYALTLKKSDAAPATVLKLAELMRYMLYECNEAQVPLTSEIKYIQNYLDLEALRLGKKADIQFTVEGDPKSALIAPLLFTPFLENAFKHGVNKHLENGWVRAMLRIDTIGLHFELRNGKAGEASPELPIKTEIPTAQGGIGLENIRQRLALLYPERYRLELIEREEVFTVRLDILFV